MSFTIDTRDLERLRKSYARFSDRRFNAGMATALTRTVYAPSTANGSCSMTRTVYEPACGASSSTRASIAPAPSSS